MGFVSLIDYPVLACFRSLPYVNLLVSSGSLASIKEPCRHLMTNQKPSHPNLRGLLVISLILLHLPRKDFAPIEFTSFAAFLSFGITPSSFGFLCSCF